MADNNDISALGPWTGDDLKATAKSEMGPGNDDDQDASIRFIRGVVDVVNRRAKYVAAQAIKDPLRLAVFILAPTPPDTVLENSPVRIPMLNNGQTVLAERIWLVNAPVVSGKYIPNSFVSDDDLFNGVTASEALSGLPTAIFDPRGTEPELRYFPHGLNDPDRYKDIHLAEREVKEEHIYDAINIVYESSLKTPYAQVDATSVWENSTKCWPCSDAEGTIQGLLKSSLSVAFPNCKIHHEQRMTSGRSDLEIESKHVNSAGLIERYAVLELKVMRTYRESGKDFPEGDNLAALEKGVKQASSYRNEKKSKVGALYCFDMRESDCGHDSCFDHVQDLAKQLSVSLRRWFLFSSSEAFRDKEATP